MTWFAATILGLVEGVTEFLPISSTAHLIMVSRLIGLPTTEFGKTLEITIQFGAILAVVWWYHKRWIKNVDIWLKVLSAFIPTAVIGFLLYKLVKTYLLANALISPVALILGGVFLIFFEKWFLVSSINEKRNGEVEIKNLKYSQAMLIGLAQALAIVPGVSRTAASVVAGRFIGLSRAAAVEFSFLLAAPTITAAAGYDLLKSGWHLTSAEVGTLLVGSITSFIFALFAIRWLVNYISIHDFKLFGIYRIIVGLLFLLWLV